MEEETNCLIIKYRAICGKYDDDEEEKCFILDEKYSKKFLLKPIKEFEMFYVTAGSNDGEFVTAKLYFLERISKKLHDKLKSLDLIDGGNEIINLLNN